MDRARVSISLESLLRQGAFFWRHDIALFFFTQVLALYMEYYLIVYACHGSLYSFDCTDYVPTMADVFSSATPQLKIA